MKAANGVLKIVDTFLIGTYSTEIYRSRGGRQLRSMGKGMPDVTAPPFKLLSELKFSSGTSESFRRVNFQLVSV
jgi:hypothetical protein